MKHIKHYSEPYTPEEIQLANEIADRLQDPAALTQFLRYAKQFPHDFLRQALNKACSTPDSQVLKSRAAIFVNSVNQYKRFGYGYSRN
ncbi:MAG: hypothetical protein JST50_09955 [Bacteroidetes bacterium]|jgi:hypothetical protein|nr:hypothetical protein [Bacteroidota bacterium]